MLRLSEDSKLAYEKFISLVNKNQKVWFLRDIENDYPVYCPSHEGDADVFPFWSNKAYAKRGQKKIDFPSEVDEIPLEDFVSKTLPYLIENNFLIGPNWDRNLAGLEICPKEIEVKLSANPP